jgi:hypothetical protein
MRRPQLLSLVSLLSLASLLPLVLACNRYREDVEYEFPVAYIWDEPTRGGEFYVFQDVWWDGAVATVIQPIIVDQAVATNRSVLDLFSGPGFIATLCGQENAKRVLSVAEGKPAKLCTRYNLALHTQDSIASVPDIDLAKSPIVPATAKYEVIFAVLADSARQHSEISLDRKLEIFFECVAANLAPSGRVFALSENEQVAEKLIDLCHEQNYTIAVQGNRLSTMTAWEILPKGQSASKPSPPQLPTNDNENEP